MKISVLQHVPVPLDVPAALARIDAAAADCAAAGSRLLVVPEASVTGYGIARAEADAVALDPDGDAAGALASIARRHGIALAWAGIVRDGPDALANLVRLVGADGRTLADYRKTHLWDALDRSLFVAGGAFSPVVEIDGVKVGLLICYDVEFPEAVRALALAGAELVVVPTALMRPYAFVAESVVPVRAYESQVHIAYANYCGPERDTVYEGRSCICGPDGAVLARAPADAPALLHADIDAASVARVRAALPYHRDRRPSLYGALHRTSTDA